MSRLVDDVKSGIKGIRGAGDAVRGSVLEASDQVFDSKNKHPASVASQEKHRAIAEKGKQDIRGADEMVARHEWQRKGVAPPGATGTGTATGTAGQGLGTTSAGTQTGEYRAPVTGSAGTQAGQYDTPVHQTGGANTGYDQRDFAPMHEGPAATGTQTGYHEAPMNQAGGVGTGYDQREFAPPRHQEGPPAAQSYQHQFEPGTRDNIREGY